MFTKINETIISHATNAQTIRSIDNSLFHNFHLKKHLCLLFPHYDMSKYVTQFLVTRANKGDIASKDQMPILLYNA